MKNRVTFAFRVTLATLIFSVLNGAARAEECAFCAQQLILSQPLADCYLSAHNRELAAATASGLSFHAVNLTACLKTRPSRGADRMPDPREKPIEPKASFLIEVGKMDCLAGILEKAEFEATAVIAIDLRKSCNE